MADTIKSLLTWVLGSVFILLMFPVTILLWLLSWPAGRSSQVVHRWVTLQGKILIKSIPLWRVRFEDVRRCRKGRYVIIANHQSLLDIPLMHLLGGDFRWVSKIENFRVPVLGLTMKMAGYIAIERGNPESVAGMMKEAARAIEDGASVIVFPEGTRSGSGNVGRFKSGAFRLALETGVQVLPVVIDGTYSVLPRKGILFSSGHPVRMKVLGAVDITGIDEGDPDRIARYFEDMFKHELEVMRSQCFEV